MQEYNIKDHVRGDTFRELEFVVSVNGTLLDLSNAIIKIDFRTNPADNKAKLSLSSPSNGITIGEEPGSFKIDEQIIDITPGKYHYDIEFNLENKIKTYIYGEFNVLQDITRS